ncbi:MAG TPA: alkaline phosphatase family protein [Bryobacteraceae bacterium]|nr:alkaline phosphatase family protein [Bryobacteraceae bacterium]
MLRKTVICLFATAALIVAWEARLFPVLKSNARAGRQELGFYLLPTNQLLRPWGEQTLLPGRPVDIAFDSHKRLMAVLNMRAVDVIEAATGARVAEIRCRGTSYSGIAFRPGDREIWASETTRNGPDSLIVAPISENGKPGEVERIGLPEHPVPAGIAFSSDGSRAYVALSRKNSLAVIDTGSRKVIREIPVDIAPFAVVVCEPCGKVYVSNRGGRRPQQGDTVAPSSGSEVVTDPVTGTATTGTISAIDLKTLQPSRIEVGRAPSGMALSPNGKILAVANGHADSVSFIDTATATVREIKIPTWPGSVIGSQPDSVTFSPRGSTLYVACGGNNAIAVVERDGASWKVAGAIPTGWFPSAIAVDAKGDLRIVNIKGVGHTANKKGTFNSKQYEGSILEMPQPAPAQIAAGTREVQAANEPRFEPSGGVRNLSALGIEHVLFIIKENRTYDQVFGDIGKGNSDPKLVMYGRDVTPNHHALAEKYVLLDNFYTGGAISFDGHQWLMQAFVSDYVERAFAASPRGYAWNMADALTVSPAGFFWQGATRPLNVHIYGEFCLPARWNPETQSVVDMNEDQYKNWTEMWRLYKENKWQNEVGCQAGVPALKRIMSPRYPNNGLNIPDQIRADEYIGELAAMEKSGQMPHVTVITLNSDHTAGTRPGSPTPKAMVADNDLALGRIVEAVSHSRFWPKTLILAVEDDAQDGVDHVDGRRTVALAIGPHIRRGAVDSNHYNHTSMVRTIQEIFEIPARTRFLTSARAMNSVFTKDPDNSPYQALTPKIPLDEMNSPLKALSGRKLWAARRSLQMNFTDIDEAPHDVLNRILWWDSKGYNTPYPK